MKGNEKERNRNISKNAAFKILNNSPAGTVQEPKCGLLAETQVSKTKSQGPDFLQC